MYTMYVCCYYKTITLLALVSREKLSRAALYQCPMLMFAEELININILVMIKLFHMNLYSYE